MKTTKEGKETMKTLIFELEKKIMINWFKFYVNYKKMEIKLKRSLQTDFKNR